LPVRSITYANISLSSVLYGSFDSGMAVNDYIPLRVMLIFVGVVTFLCVEMLVLPRSSRTIVQAQSLQFFEDLEHVMFDSSKVCRSISSIHDNSSKDYENGDAFPSDEDPLFMLREGHEKITLTDDLNHAVETVSKTVALAKRELQPGIAEPSIGLNISDRFTTEHGLNCKVGGLVGERHEIGADGWDYLATRPSSPPACSH